MEGNGLDNLALFGWTHSWLGIFENFTSKPSLKGERIHRRPIHRSCGDDPSSHRQPRYCPHIYPGRSGFSLTVFSGLEMDVLKTGTWSTELRRVLQSAS